MSQLGSGKVGIERERERERERREIQIYELPLEHGRIDFQ
jgi:hypothetical protein